MGSLYIGLMSGTSLDGIDAVLAMPWGKSVQLKAALHRPLSPRLRKRLLALQAPGPDELHRAAIAATQLTRAYAAAVRSLLSRARVPPGRIDAIGCHGQTVRHEPGAGYTVQLVNGSLLAELTGIDVVCDFRSRDIAARGEGAPLAPAFHSAFLRARGHGRAVVNIGGIANVTSLPLRGRVTGFDCGPGNCLLDAWIEVRRHRRYDQGGVWAAQGRVVPRLLEEAFGFKFRVISGYPGGAEQDLAMERNEVQCRAITIDVDLGAGTEQATIWTNDLSIAYVHENSAYST